MSKLFSSIFKGSKNDRSDYGDLFVAPSREAEAIVSSMTAEEQFNFNELLRRLQQWHESAAEQGPLSFHPEARARLWGTALGKIADHYREARENDRALFFTSAAWTLSRYPVFAYNAGLLSIETGDTERGTELLKAYLDEYPKILLSPKLRLMDPEVTSDSLEHLAKIARDKLAALQPAK